MKAINYTYYGIAEAKGRYKIGLIIYLVLLLLSLTIGLQVFQVIDSSIGQSISLETIANKFDYTVWQDLLNVHGASLSPLFGQLRWYILVYLFVSTFLHAGALYAVHKQGNSWMDFWNGAARYFAPFLGIGILIAVVLTLWTAIIWIPFLVSIFPLLEGMDRESPIIWLLILLLIIWLLGIGYLFGWSIWSRLVYIRDNTSVIRSLRSGHKHFHNHFRLSYFTITLFYLLFAAAYIVNFTFELKIGISSTLLIILFILFQQAIVFYKIQLRVALFAAFNKIANDRAYQN